VALPVAPLAFLLLYGMQDPNETYTPNSKSDPNDLHRRGAVDAPSQTIVVRGRVAVSTGGPLPAPATVEGLCGGLPQQAVFTHGDFGLTLTPSGSANAISGGGSGGPCRIRVSLAGFRAVELPVNSGGSLRADVGLIILKPLEALAGPTAPVTSVLAPPKARKAFEKGVTLAAKKKWKQARKEFETATNLYPRFAAAWCELGAVLNRLELPDEARAAYRKAIAADGKFVRAVLHLAILEAGQRQWRESARLSDQVIAQHPSEFPEAFLYNAAALYNLGLDAPAEQAVLRAIDLDTGRSFPKSFQLLAAIQAGRGERRKAAENLRLFLRYTTDASEAERARAELDELEKLPLAPARN
jgi:tetratricopeptide (TPR) repeat protein